MATIATPARSVSQAPARSGVGGTLLAMAAITLVFGSALFSVNNALLDVARSGWNHVLLIQGTFAPTLDAQKLYKAAAQTQALDRRGIGLPELTGSTKIKQYDGRIISQAAQERQIPLPDIFFKGLPGH